MPPPKDHPSTNSAALAMSGCDTKTLALTATALWDQPKDEAKADHTKIMAQFALEATTVDILGELMLKYRQQEHHVDVMSRDLKKEGLPASFHNVFRLAINNCMATLMNIREVRNKDGRDRCENPEQEEDRKKEAARQSKENLGITERQRAMGYFYDTRYGLAQAGIDLLSEDLAIRDVVRMRMLPKSPYEDYMLAKLFGCLSEAEKQMDPETLSKEEVETDLQTWCADLDAEPGDTQYREYEQLAKKIFLKRLNTYNDIWERAEKHVDGLMAIHGVKPRTTRPFVGIPPVVKKAADGDPEAIKELKALVTVGQDSDPDMQSHSARLAATQRGAGDHAQPQDSADDPYERDWGKATSIIIALLLAFTSMWTCLTLIAGPTALAVVMPCELNDVIHIDDITVDQTINRQDARQNAKNVNPNTLFDPWRSLASWRFNFSDPPFFDAFSSPSHPSG